MNDLAQTATNLRRSVGVTALALPFVLLFLEGQRDSISAYYYTQHGRDAFIGALSLISAFLWALASADWRSRYAARTAAISAALVAAFPTAPPDPTTLDKWFGGIHGLSALFFFGALAYHCWQLFPQGESKILSHFYKTCSIVIVAGILISAGGILFSAHGHYVFVMEALSIWAFGASWFIVGRPKVQRITQ